MFTLCGCDYISPFKSGDSIVIDVKPDAQVPEVEAKNRGLEALLQKQKKFWLLAGYQSELEQALAGLRGQDAEGMMRFAELVAEGHVKNTVRARAGHL